MGAIANLDTLVNTATGGTGAREQLWCWIDPRSGSSAAAATVLTKWSSLWTYNKTPGGLGVAPGAAANPTRSTTGAIGPQANPGGGRQKWLTGCGLTSGSSGVFMLYDRLGHVSGLSATTTTAQTFTLNSTRYTGTTDSIGNQIWVEIYTQIGATATTVTASYTNQAGTSGRTTKAVAFGGTGNREATRMLPLPLQDGDTGVDAIASVTVTASTATAGDFGVTLVRPISILGLTAGSMAFNDFLTSTPSMPEIKTDACLAMAYLAGTTTAPASFLTIASVEA